MVRCKRGFGGDAPKCQRKIKNITENEYIPIIFQSNLMWTDTLMKLHKNKWFLAEFLENSLKMEDFFRGFIVFPIVSETFEYL